jgi:hypothetical protein
MKALIETVNGAITAYNNSIGLALSLVGVKKIPHIDADRAVRELAEGGGSSFTVGLLDDLVKGVRRIVIPAIQSGGM